MYCRHGCFFVVLLSPLQSLPKFVLSSVQGSRVEGYLQFAIVYTQIWLHVQLCVHNCVMCTYFTIHNPTVSAGPSLSVHLMHFLSALKCTHDPCCLCAMFGRKYLKGGITRTHTNHVHAYRHFSFSITCQQPWDPCPKFINLFSISIPPLLTNAANKEDTGQLAHN